MNELRKDCIIDRWVIIAENRGKRPKDFIQKECEVKEGTCVFCPGNEHLTPKEILSIKGPHGWTVRGFENMYPATSLEFPQAFGRHEVIVEMNQHNKNLQDLPVGAIREVIDMYCSRIDDISKIDGIAYVLIFKNHGDAAGTSIAHEHSQLIALAQVPTLLEKELCAYRKYHDKTKKCIFCDILAMEMASERKIFENEHFACFAPFASRFSFESWLLPKRHVGNITDLTDEEKNSLAESLKKILTALSKLLRNPPYNYYLHIAPPQEDFHFHIEICPRVAKLAGFELGSEIVINTMPPEKAAAELRALSL